MIKNKPILKSFLTKAEKDEIIEWAFEGLSKLPNHSKTAYENLKEISILKKIIYLCRKKK